MRLIQFHDEGRKLGVIEKDIVRVISSVTTLVELANKAIRASFSLLDTVTLLKSDTIYSYDDLIAQDKIISPIDHKDPGRLWLTGTGLTHLGSASTRNKMHALIKEGVEVTDTMKMFNLGLEGGKGTFETPGVQPEWFYKGNGYTLVNPGHDIFSPSFALDGGDEVELVGIYLIGENGTPFRIGFSLGNEFSDHKTEKINYLYLAHSKLRYCSFGPEILIGEIPDDINGKSRIIRNNEIIWEENFSTGEKNMSHSIQNLEYHHFKYNLFRTPGDVHCHFFGTATISFSKGIVTQDGDIFEMESEIFGKPLRNTLKIEESTELKVTIL